MISNRYLVPVPVQVSARGLPLLLVTIDWSCREQVPPASPARQHNSAIPTPPRVSTRKALSVQVRVRGQ